MNLLLTGASGLVGAACARLAAAQGHLVTGLVHGFTGSVPGLTRQLRLDLRDPAAVRATVRNLQPAVILNAAAVAEPAQCDADPARAEALNVALPATLAEVAAETGARLIHLSSEQVFDGEHAPYAPTDTPAPINLYGRQKVTSEDRVLAAAPASAVVRLPLLLGNSLTGRRSVHEKMLETHAAGQPIKLYTDEIRQVCDADSVAAALLALAARPDLGGRLHWAGAEPISRWDLGRRLAAALGLPETSLVPIARADTPAVSARRPRDLTLHLAPLDRALGLRPQTVAEAIRDLVRPAWYR